MDSSIECLGGRRSVLTTVVKEDLSKEMTVEWRPVWCRIAYKDHKGVFKQRD